MQFRRSGGFILAAALTLTLPSASLFAQDGAKQDMKDAGHETKAAAKDTGHGIKKGTKKGYHKTKHGLKKVGHKIEGKPDTPVNNPPQ